MLVRGEDKFMNNDFYYEPKENRDLDSLLDISEYKRFVHDIEESKLTEHQKMVLKLAATRFIRFKYEKIADYYNCATPEMRDWLEQLHLVVVDYDSAISKGYFTFKEDYKKYLEELVGE